MVKNAGITPSVTLSVALGAAVLTGGCASIPGQDSQSALSPDCMKTDKSEILWGFLKSLSTEFSDECSIAKVSARLDEALKDGSTRDRALASFFSMMMVYTQGSEEKKKEVEKMLVQLGVEPDRILKVSLMFAPSGSLFGDRNCSGPRFSEDPDGTVTMSLGCFKVASDGKVQESPGHQPPAAQSAAPAPTAP